MYRVSWSDLNSVEPAKLSLWCRNELLLLSLLGPMCLSDLRAPYDPTIYAADASPYGIGVTATEGGPKLVQELWRRADTTGRSRVLLNRLRADLKEVGEDLFEDDLAIADAEADIKRQRSCPLPDGSKRVIADVRLAKTGFGDTAFIGYGVDTFARSVVVGSPPRPLIWSWHAIESAVVGEVLDAIWQKMDSRLSTSS